MRRAVLKKHSHPIRRKGDMQSLVAVLVMLVVAGVSYKLLNSSHAASPYINDYATSGTAGGVTSSITGGSSPSGNALRFGTIASRGSTSGGCTYNSIVAPCVGSATSRWGTPVFDDEFSQDTSLNSKYWASSWFNGGTMNNVSTSSFNPGAAVPRASARGMKRLPASSPSAII
jgi:hypothetical protein